jgi:hypothetical protein
LWNAVLPDPATHAPAGDGRGNIGSGDERTRYDILPTDKKP